MPPRGPVLNGCIVKFMPEWIGTAAQLAAVLVAIAALNATIWAVLYAHRTRQLERLADRIDREAAKREADIRVSMERSEREAAERRAQIAGEAAERKEQLAGEAAERKEQLGREAVERKEQLDREAAERRAQIAGEAAERKKQFDALMERSDRRFDALMERSDRRFDALQRRSDELYRQLADVTASVAHNEVVPAIAVESTSARGVTGAVAAQDVPAGRTSEGRRTKPDR